MSDPIKAKLVGKDLINENGRCIAKWQEQDGYAVHQCVGYCEDDFYVTMYALLSDDLWLPIHYTC